MRPSSMPPAAIGWTPRGGAVLTPCVCEHETRKGVTAPGPFIFSYPAHTKACAIKSCICWPIYPHHRRLQMQLDGTMLLNR